MFCQQRVQKTFFFTSQKHLRLIDHREPLVGLKLLALIALRLDLLFDVVLQLGKILGEFVYNIIEGSLLDQLMGLVKDVGKFFLVGGGRVIE